MKKSTIAVIALLAFSTTQAHAQFFEKLKTVVDQATAKDSIQTTTNAEAAGDSAQTQQESSNKTVNYTEDEANSGIKEALIKGVRQGVALVAKQDGYFGDQLIKIPFPEDVQSIESKLRAVGLGDLVDKAVLSMNRAAEDAASTATDIFIAAISNMTISDATTLVLGSDTAATHYLKVNTTGELTREFSPIINNSLQTVNATKYWDDVMTAYNKLPFVKKMNPDLGAYVTEKAIDGLFVKIAEQEKAIRANPLEQGSSLLKKIFN
ncbi:DUF4197 domain-containing protein [Mangrovibacterium marinum]|uniref:Uncharacterized protein DUF4197 n=1 Tax=Mangrovibacterium marinum TaxID=1639118 RepID=A0A2T5BY44_9BACT|nr:DUF4197 domain-containing protein [Mangrovibacterium marinum]PTN06349.1 uncharacterized protein DUF4197 [Mangrovibacterium marinum]